MKKATIIIPENGEIEVQTDGLPTMTIINALDALIKVLARDIVGTDNPDSEETAKRMRDHFLYGRYGVTKEKPKGE